MIGWQLLQQPENVHEKGRQGGILKNEPLPRKGRGGVCEAGIFYRHIRDARDASDAHEVRDDDGDDSGAVDRSIGNSRVRNSRVDSNKDQGPGPRKSGVAGPSR